MASRPTLGVVITNYNTWDLTLRCAERVLAYAGGLDEILILDDASSTPPPRPLDPRLRLETNAQNLGLVKSLNRAMATLRTDVAVLFDSDAYPENDFTEPLRRAFAEEDRLAVVGFATVDAEGRPTGSCEPEPGLASLLLGQRLHAGWLRWFAPKDGPISVYTCAMAIRRTAFAELGGFDESFDWLDLDHELSMKVNRSTWHLRRMPELLAYHEGSGTPQTTNARVLRFYKTRYRLLTKFGKIRHPALVRFLVVARLAAEAACLKVAGWLLPDRRERLREKFEGRKEVIRYCLGSYRKGAEG